MGCIIPYSPTVTIYGVKKTDKNVFFSKSDSLKTRFHNHGNIYIYIFIKEEKKILEAACIFNTALKIS